MDRVWPMDSRIQSRQTSFEIRLGIYLIAVIVQCDAKDPIAGSQIDGIARAHREVTETSGEVQGFGKPPDILFEGPESPQSTQAVLDIVQSLGDLEHARPDLLHFRGYRSATGIEQYNGARRQQAHAQGRMDADTGSQCMFHPSPALADQRQMKPE